MTTAGERTGWRDWLWPLAVLACLWAFVATHPLRPHDFWWHLKIGQETVATRHILQVDEFSYTMAGQPYPSFQAFWLADVLLYGVYSLGGPAVSVLAHTLLITGTYLLLYLLCLRVSWEARIAALGVLAAAALGFENWNVRPQAFVFPLFVLALWLIHAFRSNPRLSRWLILVFPILMIVWVNCHGSFPLLILLVGVWLVETVWELVRVGRPSGRVLWVPAAALALSAAAVLVNPMGLGIFTYLREMGGNPVVQGGPEWAPASLATKDGIVFFVLAAAGLVMLLLAGRKRSGLFHWMMLIGFGLLAWRMGRAIVWFGFVLAPIVAELLPHVLAGRGPRPASPDTPPSSRDTPRPSRDGPVVAVIMLCFVGLMVATLPWFKDRLPLPERKAGLISTETPVRATDFLLQQRLPGRVFHNMVYGSYLIWAGWPQYRVFVDPRIELYPARLWDTYYAVSRGDPGWQGHLDRFGVNTLMLSRQEQAGLIVAVASSRDWRRVYEDRMTVVFVRRKPVTPRASRSDAGTRPYST
jgi:hypothetical protein